MISRTFGSVTPTGCRETRSTRSTRSSSRHSSRAPLPTIPVAPKMTTFIMRADRNRGELFDARWLSLCDLLHDDADVVRVNEIRRRPPIEVVLGHALFGEALVA